MKKPERKRLVLADRLLLELLRERKLELVLVPDIARDQWPPDMRLIGVDWDGGRIVATLEAEAWPVAGDWLELLYRAPASRPPVTKPEVDPHAAEIWAEENV